MEKILLSSVLLGGLFLGGLSPVVHAGEKDAQTKGTVNFIENKEPTPPVVNPVKPDDPNDPNQDPDKPTNNTDALRIDLAPNFHFGEITLGSGTVSAENNRKNSNLQVTDSRGTLDGWQVSVKRSDFKNGENVLKNTVLNLTPGSVIDAKGNSTKLNGNVSKSVAVNTDSNIIFAASKGEGGGTYVQNFDANKATLVVDTNNALKGTYTSNITWTIQSDNVNPAG